MIQKPPYVTVLMPTYNDKRFIDEAITSVLNQTMSHFELLIIDDTSTDKTPVILARYMKRDNRIRVIHNKENLGLTKSLNIGLKHARGEYIARMDADDISAEKRLEKQLTYMISHPECDFLATRTIVISESGKHIKKTKINFKGKNIKNCLLDIGSPFVHSSMMMRKETLDELGGYNENWPTRQDYELWLHAAFANKKFAYLNECLLFFRFHKNSLSVSKKENLLTNLLLRAYYRAKDKGKKVDIKNLKEKVENSEVLTRYTEFIIRRRKIKHLIGHIQLLNVKSCFGDICELIKLILFGKKRFNQRKINIALDYLCSLCEINQNQ